MTFQSSLPPVSPWNTYIIDIIGVEIDEHQGYSEVIYHESPFPLLNVKTLKLRVLH